MDVQIIAAAEAMRVKRAELLDLPLDRIWLNLAKEAAAILRSPAAQSEDHRSIITHER